MPITKSATRAVRVSGRKAKRNKSINSAVKTDITRAEKLIAGGDVAAAKQAVDKAASALDKAAAKGILHDKNAARRKSRLVKKMNKATATAAPKDQQEGAK